MLWVRIIGLTSWRRMHAWLNIKLFHFSYNSFFITILVIIHMLLYFFISYIIFDNYVKIILSKLVVVDDYLMIILNIIRNYLKHFLLFMINI